MVPWTFGHHLCSPYWLQHTLPMRTRDRIDGSSGDYGRYNRASLVCPPVPFFLLKARFQHQNGYSKAQNDHELSDLFCSIIHLARSDPNSKVRKIMSVMWARSAGLYAEIAQHDLLRSVVRTYDDLLFHMIIPLQICEGDITQFLNNHWFLLCLLIPYVTC